MVFRLLVLHINKLINYVGKMLLPENQLVLLLHYSSPGTEIEITGLPLYYASVILKACKLLIHGDMGKMYQKCAKHVLMDFFLRGCTSDISLGFTFSVLMQVIQ